MQNFQNLQKIFFLVEVMTYVAWRLSNFQAFKVIGFGTILESSMLKQLIANKMECSIKNVQAFIAGEQASNGSKLIISYSQ